MVDVCCDDALVTELGNIGCGFGAVGPSAGREAALDGTLTGVAGEFPLVDMADPGASKRENVSGLPKSSAFSCCFFCSTVAVDVAVVRVGVGAVADLFAALSRDASAFLSASSSESSARGAPLVKRSIASSTLPSVIIRALRDTRDGKPISTILVTTSGVGRYEVLILGSLDGCDGGDDVGAGADEDDFEGEEVSLAADCTEDGIDPIIVGVGPALATFFWAAGKGC